MAIKLMKNMIRGLRDVSILALDVMYHYYRYLRYSGMIIKLKGKAREYKVIRIYHALEKSLSYRNRNSDSGWGVAKMLVKFLTEKEFTNENITQHEKVAIRTLVQFVDAAQKTGKDYDFVKSFTDRYSSLSSDNGGTIDYTRQHLDQGKLENPEIFFNSRYTVRDFSSRPVERDIILHALSLANKTPSACNRQAWHVYHLDQRNLIDFALRHQSGNRGFGHEVPSLLIVASDVRAFEPPCELNQQLIDGGMYAMSIVMALHSLGVGSCCLNWSKGMVGDVIFRKHVPIDPCHTVIMMLAVGYPNEELRVCSSVRSPIQSLYTHLDKSALKWAKD